MPRILQTWTPKVPPLADSYHPSLDSFRWLNQNSYFSPPSIKAHPLCRSSIATPSRARLPQATASRSLIRPTAATHCLGVVPPTRSTHLDLRDPQVPRNQAHRIIAVVTIVSSSVPPRTRRFKLPVSRFSVLKLQSEKQIRRSWRLNWPSRRLGIM
jgi:hypothetical protein